MTGRVPETATVTEGARTEIGTATTEETASEKIGRSETEAEMSETEAEMRRESNAWRKEKRRTTMSRAMTPLPHPARLVLKQHPLLLHCYQALTKAA